MSSVDLALGIICAIGCLYNSIRYFPILVLSSNQINLFELIDLIFNNVVQSIKRKPQKAFKQLSLNHIIKQNMSNHIEELKLQHYVPIAIVYFILAIAQFFAINRQLNILFGIINLTFFMEFIIDSIITETKKRLPSLEHALIVPNDEKQKKIIKKVDIVNLVEEIFHSIYLITFFVYFILCIIILFNKTIFI